MSLFIGPLSCRIARAASRTLAVTLKSLKELFRNKMGVSSDATSYP